MLNSCAASLSPPVLTSDDMSSVAPARRAAFQILINIERGQAHSDDLLRSKAIDALSAPDRNLVTTLVLGVLRWQSQLDACVRPALKRPNARLDPEVRIALRLGAFQLLHLDRIPPHAAIGESVELTRQAGHRFASGMVNAVLRKLSAAPRPEPPSGELPPAPLAAAYAHPAWIVERWTALFGSERTCALCRHDQQAPPLAVRLATPDAEKGLLDAGVTLTPGSILTVARTVTSGDITATPAFREGRVRIQDEGSQLVAEIASAAVDPDAERILDACAAPGGKTLILAERHPQAHITACDASAPRLQQLQSRLAAFGSRIATLHADASALDDHSIFGLVLTDVPCSGTGTLGRNPEIRHRLTPEELPRQSERQQAILRTALRAVRPGGRVVYSTCSLEPEENEEVLGAVLAADPSARVTPVQAILDTLLFRGILHPAAAERLRAAVTPAGYLRLFPDLCNTDGFFIAVLERTA